MTLRMIKTYKPVDTARIEAMLFTEESQGKAEYWAGSDLEYIGAGGSLWQVQTLEGWVDMPYGSYLIKGTSGEFYPCDPDIFEKRWVEVV